jgi:phosphatidylglycerophosphate synthase
VGTELASKSENRRPLAARGVGLFQWLARWLADAGVTPNAISAASMLFGCAAGLAFAWTFSATGWLDRICWFVGAVFIQLRLLANMLDGMVAVEGRRGEPTGEVWNEVPDRVSDVAILIGAGYAAGSSPVLGLLAAISAVSVAYVRAIGASTGVGQVFTGPMAKPQRMFWLSVVALYFALTPVPLDAPDGWLAGVLMTLVLVGAIFDVKAARLPTGKSRVLVVAAVLVATLALRDYLVTRWLFPVMPVALFAIATGGAYTAFLRLREISARLRKRAANATVPGIPVAPAP